MRFFAGAMICAMVLVTSLCLADDTLVGYWAFEEGGGDTAEDSSDYGNDGLIQGQAHWQGGKVGNGLALVRDGLCFKR